MCSKIIKIMPLAVKVMLKIPCHGRSAARWPSSKQSKDKDKSNYDGELLDDRLAEARGALDVLLLLARDDGEPLPPAPRHFFGEGTHDAPF